MRNVYSIRLINAQYDIVLFQAAVESRSPAADNFRHVNTRVVVDVRIVATAGDAEP